MDPPVVPVNRRHRMYRDYTVDDDDIESQTSPPTSPGEEKYGSSGPVMEPSSFYHDRSTSRATEATTVTQVRGHDEDSRLDDDGGSTNSDSTAEAPWRGGSTTTKTTTTTAGDLKVRPLTTARRSAHSHKSSIVRTEEQRRDLRAFDFELANAGPTKQSAYADSVASVSAVSQAASAVSTGAISSMSGNRLPDFFSSEIFQTVLHNPTTSHRLLEFSRTRMCGENMEFLEKIHKYHDLLNAVTQTMFEVHKDFLSPGGGAQVNISESLLLHVRKDLKQTLAAILPRLEGVFDDCSAEIERLVATDIYPRFVRHQLVLSASRALASNRGKYAGLGDCFVLTNPRKADNPIVFASDGFAKVTGYSRNEIIPRNCRFLQGRQTDRQPVNRLKASIENHSESVELILNYKKNGEPFWNLLYVTPLYDWEGNLAFFLGGQINCSTTIHNANDILMILAAAEDEEEEPTTPTNNATSPRQKPDSFFKRLRHTSRPPPTLRNAGMEGTLLNRIEKLNLGSQMTEFYTAYSKFIIVNAATCYISFHSYGILALLYPVKQHKSTVPGLFPENLNVVRPRRVMTALPPMPAQQQAQQHQAGHGPGGGVGPDFNDNNQVVNTVAGLDIFKFLMQHTMGSLSRDFKAAVKNAARTGSPVSLDLNLCTRRRMGFEKFVTHWTPLKDELGRTEFLVLTLGGVE